ncbi:biopolymer transporter ExbD [Phormidium yuhuli AB48]|uniref:Biopolymer transporter ExbD n=1 Tax=Phormidium yuhuli AB48 TaxID=2940671 RepID=A0ABY5AQ40_9CYAN|nr:biopolymer transporter ExbD [Phormidium yuhuli]USR90273.1 biopolymer transporter ExbD [Phormidium yuhuli AB48]
MKFRQNSSRDEIPELEITPMLNVMLVVLAFFVAVAANLAEEGQHLRVRLPQEAEALDIETPETEPDSPEEREFLQVVLQEGGQLFANDRPIEKAQLLEQVPGYLQRSPHRRVYLRVSGDVAYETVIETLTALKEIGGDRVSLVIGSGESR